MTFLVEKKMFNFSSLNIQCPNERCLNVRCLTVKFNTEISNNMVVIKIHFTLFKQADITKSLAVINQVVYSGFITLFVLGFVNPFD